MSSKPSRSEIETALAPSRKSRPGKSSKDTTTPEFGPEPNRRRQQVIGGDLGGVSSRRNNTRFGFLKNINFVNWIAAAIVLLILLAFFWPHADDNSTREIPGQVKEIQSESFYSESRIDTPPLEAPELQSFSRPNDLERADDYRDQTAMERRIERLLAQASDQIKRGEYTQPAGNNASNTYQQILLLSPNNLKAEQGLEYIRGRFLESGIVALQANQPAVASQSLEKLGAVDNQSDEYQQLDSAIANWQVNSKINQLLAQADDAYDETRLILPARENALYYYQQVLILDQNNALANAGIAKIADSFINKANTAIRAGQFDSATSYLATVSVIDPEHQSLSLLEETITRARPIAQQIKSQEQASVPAATKPAADNVATITPKAAPTSAARRQPRTNNTRTKPNEQESVDRQFLVQGLDAYYKGEYETAAALLQPLADKGISRAQFRIGYMYYQGRGFKRDREEADQIIRAALPSIQKFADQGRAWAQSDIGSLYEDGLVLPRDYGEAVYWYRSAAEQGYPGAQTNLGIMYARGRGVGSSRRTAIEWFQRAAKQGDILAKRNLESMGISP